MKKVLTFGTFDKFHPGHEFYLKESKKLGNFLYVIVARDTTVEKVKGRSPFNNEIKRLEKISSLDYVDRALLGDLNDPYRLIEEIKPDIICLGYDQTAFTDSLEKKLNEMGINPKIIKIKDYMPHKYKSSKL